jgi:hypothetical protein
MRQPIRLSPFFLPVVLVCVLRTSHAPGQAVGPEFRVNSYTSATQGPPRAAMDVSGKVVVVWQSISQEGSNTGVFGQRYDGLGAPLGAEFRVNSYTTDDQRLPAVASDSGGNVFVVWHSYAQDSSAYGVFGQRYGSAGAPLGPEFRVNSYTTSNQRYPSVASDSGGNFVVVWSSTQQDGYYSVFGQRYGSAGSPLGTEFVVNTYTTVDQSRPIVASASSGNFVVVWASNTQDGSSSGIFGQRFGSAGAPLGAEFRVNTYTTGNQDFPLVASDSVGNFVVVWQSDTQDGSPSGVFGQRYGSAGAPLGAEFLVNTYTTGNQLAAFVASASGGSFIVAWMSDAQDGSNFGVFGQRFCPALSAVSVSTTGSLAVCKGSTGGTATVNDTGGGFDLHQWYYRTIPSGPYVPISGETGPSYVIKGNDFSNGAPGGYYLFCLTTPTCGSQIFSSDNTIVITVSADNTAPSVTPPPAATTTQTLCM